MERCPDHPAYEPDNCPLCGTSAVIGWQQAEEARRAAVLARLDRELEHFRETGEIL